MLATKEAFVHIFFLNLRMVVESVVLLHPGPRVLTQLASFPEMPPFHFIRGGKQRFPGSRAEIKPA